MDCLVDLDTAAATLAKRLSERPDLTPGPITWKGFETQLDGPF